MKPLHLIPLSLALASCLSTVTPPLQVGPDKYKILYENRAPGDDLSIYESKAINQSQAFCREKGFERADMIYSSPRDYAFMCMKPGEVLTRRPDHQILEVR